MHSNLGFPWSFLSILPSRYTLQVSYSSQKSSFSFSSLGLQFVHSPQWLHPSFPWPSRASLTHWSGTTYNPAQSVDHHLNMHASHSLCCRTTQSLIASTLHNIHMSWLCTWSLLHSPATSLISASQLCAIFAWSWECPVSCLLHMLTSATQLHLKFFL